MVHRTSTVAFSCCLIIAPKVGFQFKVLTDTYYVYVENVDLFPFMVSGTFQIWSDPCGRNPSLLHIFPVSGKETCKMLQEINDVGNLPNLMAYKVHAWSYKMPLNFDNLFLEK